MKKHILFIMMLVIGTIITAQDNNYKSIHQIDWEAHQHDAEIPQLNKSTVVAVDPIQERDPNGPQLTHAVFGYLPDWEYSSAPQYFDYSVLSHIALFDFLVDPQGNITQNPSGWPSNWMTMMNTAHANGVKLIMCVVEFDDADIHTLINSSTASNNFYQNVANILTTYNLDGVNIDFEGPQVADRGAPMNSFMQGLSNYIKTNVGQEQEISFAGPAVNWSGWDLPGLVDACDYVFIMGYAYWWNGSSTTGPCAPITGSSINLVQTIVNSSNGYGNCDRSKLILGLPYYGYKWKVSYAERAKENAATLERGSSVVYASARDYYNSYGTQWSTTYEDTWTYYQSGSDWYQAWCNNARALDAKEELVFSYDLMGTGMWALGYDDEHPDLWEVLRENFLILDDSLMLDNFEDGVGHFYRQPNYSGSSQGISSSSWSDTTSETAFVDDHALKIVLKDDSESNDDWQARILSGSGAPANNIILPRARDIHFALKTDQPGMEVAVLIDDEDSELESSIRFSVIADNEWHEYNVRLDSCDLWMNYSNGNGAIDGDYVTLDALMFYAPQQTSDRVVYLDAIKAIKIDDPIQPAVSIIPESCSLRPNYPNPFNARTTLEYDITSTSRVKLSVYDMRGKHVQTLVNDIYAPGSYSYNWDCSFISSGMYIAVLQVDGKIMGSRKMLLVK